MFTLKHYVEVGGFMSYGVKFPPTYRRAADCVARVLQGTKPAELPLKLDAPKSSQEAGIEYAVGRQRRLPLSATFFSP